MLTTSETILFTTVWTLTGIGLFFGTKAKLRRRREKKQKDRAGDQESSIEKPKAE